MVSEEELKKAIIDIMKDSNDLESAKTIFEAVAIDNYYITAGRVNIVRVAMKCILEYLKNPRNLNITETRREIVKLKEIEKSHQEENGKLRVELEQEKEKNKEIAIKNRALKEESNACGEQIVSLDNQLKAKEQEIAYLKSQIPSDKIFYFSDKDYISKDKIKERLAELENKSGGNSYYVQAMINAEKNILKELLEGK